jgi:predicted bacteriocin transport accessory protein
MLKKYGHLLIISIIIIITISISLTLKNNNSNNETIDITAYKTADIYNNNNGVGELIDTDTELFEKIQASDKVSIIYIARPSCSFCNRFEPIVKEVAAEYGLDMYYTNIDEWAPNDVERYLYSTLNKFEGTPTVLIMYKGKEANISVGYQKKESFVNFLKSADLIR